MVFLQPLIGYYSLKGTFQEVMSLVVTILHCYIFIKNGFLLIIY
jgi:hypothetical protein